MNEWLFQSMAEVKKAVLRTGLSLPRALDRVVDLDVQRLVEGRCRCREKRDCAGNVRETHVEIFSDF